MEVKIESGKWKLILIAIKSNGHLVSCTQFVGKGALCRGTSGSRPERPNSKISCSRATANTYISLNVLNCIVKKQVKCSRYRPGVAQTVGRGIALLFHDRGTRRG